MFCFVFLSISLQEDLKSVETAPPRIRETHVATPVNGCAPKDRPGHPLEEADLARLSDPKIPAARGIPPKPLGWDLEF